MMKKQACFLDRDGVLNEEVHYLSDPEKARLCPGVVDAIRLAHERGMPDVVVSNQAGIAHGYFTEAQLKAVEARIDELLAEQGERLDGIYYCFHHPKGIVPEYAVDCDCRKPKPGMLLRAAREMDLNLAGSFLIGDRIRDLEAGLGAGCRAVALVRTGHGPEEDFSPMAGRENVFDCPDVLTAVRTLLQYCG